MDKGEYMNKEIIKESVRKALKEVVGQITEDESLSEKDFMPQDKEHLSKNKKLLNEELMKKWGFNKKK